MSGEVFSGIEVPDGESDADALFRALTASEANVASVLSDICGPWAVVFWQEETDTLWFGRDVFGGLALSLPLSFALAKPWLATGRVLFKTASVYIRRGSCAITPALSAIILIAAARDGCAWARDCMPMPVVGASRMQWYGGMQSCHTAV